MTNLALNGNFLFDEELSLSSSPDPFTGSPQLIGVLENIPVMLLVKNFTDQTIFLSIDEEGTKGTTMIETECFVLDCRGNKGNASNGGFPIGTSFFATVPEDGLGSVKISIVYAT